MYSTKHLHEHVNVPLCLRHNHVSRSLVGKLLGSVERDSRGARAIEDDHIRIAAVELGNRINSGSGGAIATRTNFVGRRAIGKIVESSAASGHFHYSVA